MKLAELAGLIDGKILEGADQGDLEIDRAYAADLLSDVLALTDERTALVTGTVSPQVIRVAEILSVTTIIFVRGNCPQEKVLEYARKLRVPIVATKKTMFETCGLMYANGVRSCRNRSANELTAHG